MILPFLLIFLLVYVIHDWHDYRLQRKLARERHAAYPMYHLWTGSECRNLSFYSATYNINLAMHQTNPMNNLDVYTWHTKYECPFHGYLK